MKLDTLIIQLCVDEKTTKYVALNANVGRTLYFEGLQYPFRKTPLTQAKQYAKSYGYKQLQIMKDKILSGEFTPNITNSFTHWNAKIHICNEIRKFRSSWEACFWLSNQHLKYENVRIPYIDKNGINRVVIPDFNDTINNIIYEIKPKKYFLIQKEKIDATIKYCIDNNLEFKWINEYNILEYINESVFSDENYQQLLKMKKGLICKK